MVTKLGINGFGRIGRNVLRTLIESPIDGLQVVHINELCDVDTAAHLLRYDSIHGRLSSDVTAKNGALYVAGTKLRFTNELDPGSIDWASTGAEIVLECTGRFTKRADAAKHLTGGVKGVLISGPSQDADKTVVYGVNHSELTPSHQVVSNASCTTNCLAPIAQVLHRELGIENGYMTAVHAYTADQRLVDSPHKDLRRARAAALSAIPTSTGAARALKLVIPELEGLIDGSAIRVPIANVSMVDLTIRSKRETTVEEVNAMFQRASAGPLGYVLGTNTLPLVSVDFLHNRSSSIFDATQTAVIGGNMVRVVGWYDNEWGFANRMLDVSMAMAH